MSALVITLADTPELISACLADIAPVNQNKAEISLAVDLEGINLCRTGKLCILQIKSNASPTGTIWLIDVTTLGSQAFEAADPTGRTLKSILEDPAIKKLFYDVRNDSDALYNLYGVCLAGVYDLQLLELAVRLSRGARVRFLSGLKAAITTHTTPPRGWARTKDAGHALFAPERGGAYAVFERRPLGAVLEAYCAQDVALLFALERGMRGAMGPVGRDWEARIGAESRVRVARSKEPGYNGKGKDQARAPVGW